MSKSIEITGVSSHNPDSKILGYAVCRQWRDNHKDVQVYEYASTEREAKDIIKKLPKSDRYKWFVGVYQ